MEKINVHDAKTNFSRLLERAEKGEEFVIARAGKPVAQALAEPMTLLTTDATLGRYGPIVRVV